MDRSSSQYDSFLFWRQPIPTLDLSELEDLGLLQGPAQEDREEEVSGRLRPIRAPRRRSDL